MSVIPTLYAVGGIKDADKVRVVIYINNTLCHVPLNKLLELVPKQVDDLKKEVNYLKQRLSVLEEQVEEEK